MGRMERIPPKNKILVVDDEPDVVELIRPGLINVGYTVVYAKNGPQALEEVSLDQPDPISDSFGNENGGGSNFGFGDRGG